MNEVYANKAETLAHMQRGVAINRQNAGLLVWVTAAGKAIDETVLRELAALGLVEVREAQRNMWSSPSFKLTQAGLDADPSSLSIEHEFDACSAEVRLAEDISTVWAEMFKMGGVAVRRERERRYYAAANLRYEIEQSVREA